MFIRFVVAADSENPWSTTGVITATRILQDDGKLHDYQSDVVNAAFDWFDHCLPCPPFKERRETGTWSADAVAWFRPNAKEAISRMWDLVAVLKDHGQIVRIFRTNEPGEIVYSDTFQVVAETPRQHLAGIRI